MENLETFINDERLLDLALWVLVRDPENQEADAILGCYVSNHFINKGLDPTDKEYEDYAADLFIDYTQKMLVDEGMGTVSFDEDGAHYDLTPEGQEVMFAVIKARYENGS